MAKKGEDDVPAWGKDDGKDNETHKPGSGDMPMVGGEVTSRRVHKVSKEEVAKQKEEYITLAWDDVFPKKPRDRLRWLYKAFKAAKEKKIKAQPLFDIVAHRKFLEGLTGETATDTLNLIRGNLSIFSAKQQKQLTSDNFELYRKYAPVNVLDSDEDEDDAPPLPPPPEVIIEDKKTRKRNKGKAKESVEDESWGSDDDTETKKHRILSKGVERRIDPADGQAYTLEEFIQVYGGTEDRPPDLWVNQRSTSFIFKE